MATMDLPEVNFSEFGEVRYLHLGTEWVQGSMLIDAPFDIELDYVQRMEAWLLFVEPDSVGKRHAMQLGLGAAALTKFSFKKLRMKTTAIELNPQVLAVCRQWFKLPPDSARLREAAELVELLRSQGRSQVLVACALGISRSAAVVAAWLCLTGRAATVDAACDWVRQARPQVRLSPAWRECIARAVAATAADSPNVAVSNRAAALACIARPVGTCAPEVRQ